MASTEPTNNSPSHSRRRSSLSVSELLAAHRASSSIDTGPSVRNAHPAMTSAVTQAAQQPHARRLSITTLGLSGAGGSSASAGPTSGGVGRSNSVLEATGIRKGMGRHASISEHENESAVVDDMDTVSPPAGAGGGSMSRRLSSGAKAYRDVRTTSSGGSMLPGFTGQQSPTTTTKTQGFNWSENLRTRAQRTSVSAGAGNTIASAHTRSRSTAASEPAPLVPAPPPAPAPPAAAVPSPPARRGLFEFEGGKPDPMQERILRGQFHMD